jgi:hypothetical protein
MSEVQLSQIPWGRWQEIKPNNVAAVAHDARRSGKFSYVKRLIIDSFRDPADSTRVCRAVNAMWNMLTNFEFISCNDLFDENAISPLIWGLLKTTPTLPLRTIKPPARVFSAGNPLNAVSLKLPETVRRVVLDLSGTPAEHRHIFAALDGLPHLDYLELDFQEKHREILEFPGLLRVLKAASVCWSQDSDILDSAKGIEDLSVVFCIDSDTFEDWELLRFKACRLNSNTLNLVHWATIKRRRSGSRCLGSPSMTSRKSFSTCGTE